MIQFLIVALIVFCVTGYFWDIETAIKTGPKLLDFWILAGLAVIIVSPFINIARLAYYLFTWIAGLFRRKSPR